MSNSLVTPDNAEEPETNPSVPQQEEQSYTAEGKVIIDYGLDVDYEESEPKIEPDAQEEKDENSDKEYTNIDIPCDRTLCQRMSFLLMEEVMKDTK